MTDVFDGIDAIQLRNELFLLGTTTLEDCATKDLVNLALAAKDAYYNSDQPLLTDDQYDMIERFIALSSPEDDVTTIVGSDVRGDAVPLPFPMGGLTQAYEGDVAKWVAKCGLGDRYIFISDKLDGNSAELVYDANGNFTAAFTRGDGFEGADITRHLKQMNFPKSVRKGIRAVRAEIILRKDKFERVQQIAKRTYKNPRNMVAGLMNASVSNSDVLAELSVIAYEIMNQAKDAKENQFIELLSSGFEVPKHSVWHGSDFGEDRLTHYLEVARQDSWYEIDGLVIEALDKDLRESLKPSTETLEPEYARKFKVADASNMAVAEVVSIHWGISKNGYLKPRVEIKPVDLVGVTVTYATGFHAWFIYSNHIGPGAKIRITRSGDVIPFITQVVEPMPIYDYDPWFISQLNAIGEWAWTDTMIDAFLVSEHPAIALEKATFFFTTLDVAMLREGNLVKLFEAGYNSPAKIMKMHVVEMRTVLGENGTKIWAALEAKRLALDSYILMAATGLLGRGVGRKKLKKLLEASQGDETIFADYNRILAVEGFQTKTAQRIIGGYKAYQDFVADLAEYINFKQFVVGGTGGELAGQVYVFTGFRDKELQTKLEDLGGIVGDSFSSKTTCVVAKDPNEDSGKLKKAREKGIKIVGYQQLKEEME
jgi:DNA ligase (NAD+)